MLYHLVSRLSIGLLFILITFIFQTKYSFALDCGESYPIIGTVSKTEKENNITKIFITKPYTFDNRSVKSDGIYNIDKYENLAIAYVNADKKDLLPLPQTYLKIFNAINIQTTDIDENLMKTGDIIINGHPFYVCDNGFTGVFDANGNLKIAIIQDQYEDYSYKQNILSIEPDQELECDNITSLCKTSVKFKFKGSAVTLNPKESHSYINEVIKKITLLDSSNTKSNSKYNSLSEWGIGIFAKYVIYFEDTDSVNAGNKIQNQINLYTIIWNWFISLF